MISREEAFEKAGFTNDMIFKEVMRIRPNLCRRIINKCYPDMDTENMTVTTEYEVVASIEDRRVRLDVLSEKEGDRVDLEMYRYNPGLERQMRYHASMLDSQLPMDSLPKDMPDVTVIALCTFDPFGLGEPVYSAHSMLEQFPEYPYNDGRKLMFVSPTHEEKASEEIRPLLAVLKENAEMPEDPFVKEVMEAVREVKTNREFRRHFMDEMTARQAERQEGFDLGTEKTIIIEIKNLRKLGIKEDQILSILTESHSLTEEKARELMEKASAQ